MGIDKDYDFFLENILGLMVINAEGNLVYMNRQCADYIKMDQENKSESMSQKYFLQRKCWNC